METARPFYRVAALPIACAAKHKFTIFFRAHISPLSERAPRVTTADDSEGSETAQSASIPRAPAAFVAQVRTP
jgi:hypothetical protein